MEPLTPPNNASIVKEIFPSVSEFLNSRHSTHKSSSRKRSFTDRDSFFSAPSSSSSKRQCPSLQLSFEDQLDQERESLLQQSVLVENKATIIDLQNQVKWLKSEIEKNNIEHEMQVEKTKIKHAAESLRLSELEYRLKEETSRREQIVSRLKKQLEESQEENLTLQRKTSQLEIQKSELEGSYEERVDLLNEDLNCARNDSVNLGIELAESNEQLQLLKDSLQEEVASRRQVGGELVSMQEKLCENETLQLKIRSLEEEVMQVRTECKEGLLLKYKLNRMEDIENRNRKLQAENDFHRATLESNILLCIQKESLQGKLEDAEREVQKYNTLLVEHATLKKRLAKWEDLESSTDNPLSADEMKRQISHLQTENIIMLERQGQLQTQLKQTQLLREKAAVEVKSLKQQLTKTQTEYNTAKDALRRTSSRVNLLSKERASLSDLVKSYEMNRNLKVNASLQKRMREAESTNAEYESLLAERDEELETVSYQLEETQEQLANLECENQVLQSNTEPVPEDSSHKVLAELRKHIIQTETALEKSITEKAELEQKLKDAQARPIPSVSRSSILDEDIERTRKQNEDIRRRLSLEVIPQ